MAKFKVTATGVVDAYTDDEETLRRQAESRLSEVTRYAGVSELKVTVQRLDSDQSESTETVAA